MDARLDTQRDAAGQTIGDRLKRHAAELAKGYGFQYGAVFRRLIARG